MCFQIQIQKNLEPVHSDLDWFCWVSTADQNEFGIKALAALAMLAAALSYVELRDTRTGDGAAAPPGGPPGTERPPEPQTRPDLIRTPRTEGAEC